jgi:tetratricopeptide (TPR) repeat protein
MPVFLLSLTLAIPVWAGAKLTPDEAQKRKEDLRSFAAAAPKTHKDLYHAIPAEQFEARVKQLDERVPGLTREQVIVEIARIVAAIGDGHSYMNLWSPEVGFHALPARLYVFRDGLYVLAAKSEHVAIVGGRVVRVGSRPIDDAIAAVRELVSRDNDSGVCEHLPMILSVPEVLVALGIADSPEHVSLTVLKEGREVTADLPAIAGADAESFPQSANAWDSLGEVSMIRGNKEEAIKNYEKSLELNPGNGNARVMIRRLKG